MPPVHTYNLINIHVTGTCSKCGHYISHKSTLNQDDMNHSDVGSLLALKVSKAYHHVKECECSGLTSG